MSILLVGMLTLITGCTSNGNEEIQMVSVDKVETIYIDHGSTNVYVDSIEAEELETSFISYDNRPRVKLNQRDHEIKISLSSDIWRMFNLGRMPELIVRIPQGYTGEIVVHGSSGQVHMLDVDASDIEVNGKSSRI
ncbi:DUF4097 family beta strand repeat-containing protein [Paenibacillus urinalis]|uniref:DUF4097 family beta strand repeat-containing protein n=1 Tax=Paenibacillus urinalis TaxID=521520 RepID=UPI00195F9C7A